MPSGLTCRIYDGTDISLRGFALKCVTQLGAGYYATNQGSKEMPLDKPPVIPMSDYHQKQLDKAKKDVEYWFGVEKNPEELDRLYNAELEKRKQQNAKYSDDNSELKSRYLVMLSKVESWDVPDEYASLKELMIKQLNESLDHDCRPCKPYSDDFVSKEEWIKMMTSMACRDVQYHTDEMEKEKRHNKEMNDYLAGLYDAIDKVEPL